MHAIKHVIWLVKTNEKMTNNALLNSLFIFLFFSKNIIAHLNLSEPKSSDE